MVTYLINVNNCINMEFYDFLFYEAQANREVVIFNVKDLEHSDKQIENLILELEEHYFENDNKNYQILFCIPRNIKSPEDFTDNSNFVLSYKIKQSIKRYLSDANIYLVSFVYCSAGTYEDFKNVNEVISSDFYCDSVDADFPCFSQENRKIKPEEYPDVDSRILESILQCGNESIRRIFSAVWEQYGLRSLTKEIVSSEKAIFNNCAHDQLTSIKLPAEKIINILIDTSDIAGLKNKQMESTLTFIDAVIHAKEPFKEDSIEKHTLDIPHYAALLSDYSQKLKHTYKDNPPQRSFVYSYREPSAAIDECEDRFKRSNQSVYMAIQNQDARIFTDTIKTLKGKALKDETQWDQAYKDILRQIDMTDSSLADYMESMSLAFAKSERISEKVDINYENIGFLETQLEVDFKEANQELLAICESSDVGYKTTLDAKNELTKLNRRIKNILHYEKLQRVLPFLLTLLFSVLSFLIPYSISETHVFSTANGWMIWLISNAAFAVLSALGSVVVYYYFHRKKQALFKQVVTACDSFFHAYLEMAKLYSKKLKAIAKIEKISTERAFLKQISKEFKLYEKKLSYHKNCIARLVKSLMYYNNLLIKASKVSVITEESTGINLDKDETRNSFYYP